MSIWSLATELAIWTLIAGSLAVFGWFLVEVVRLAGIGMETDEQREPRDTEEGES